MRQIVLPLFAVFGLASPGWADPETPAAAVRMLRVEGAAVDVRRAAEDVEEILKNIYDSGTLGHFTTLETRLDALHRMTVSARMAVDVAVDEMGTVPPE